MSKPRRIETARSVVTTADGTTIIHTDGTTETVPAGEELEFGTVHGGVSMG